MYGPVSNDAEHCGTTRQLIGGEGTCYWKTLVNGMHLNGNWNVVEYLDVPAGASIGEHTHLRTEEIYYILTGRARMRINGEETDVAAGDLITNPIEGRHAIASSLGEDMTFLVVEVFPGADPSGYEPVRIGVRERLAGEAGVRGARTDLRPYFSGDWCDFSLLELAPEARVEPHALEAIEQVLFVVRGEAGVHVGGETVGGGPGLTVSVPPGTASGLENRSSSEPLEVAVTEVRVAPGA